MNSESPPTLTIDQCQLLLEALLNKDGTPKQQRRGIRNYTLALVRTWFFVDPEFELSKLGWQQRWAPALEQDVYLIRKFGQCFLRY